MAQTKLIFDKKYDLTHQDTAYEENNEYQRAAQKCYKFLLSIKNRKFEIDLKTIVQMILDHQTRPERYSETLLRLIDEKRIY